MEKEINISVFDIVETSTPQGRETQGGVIGGDKVRETIEEAWDKYEKINILFEKIVQMTRVFTDEAFGKLLENHSLEDFNQKLFFPDAREEQVKELNSALKLRMKIISSQREHEENKFGI